MVDFRALFRSHDQVNLTIIRAMRVAIPVSYEEVPRDVIATERLYPSGFIHPDHTHVRGQFAYAAEGAMTVSTTAGNWIVPPQCAVWLPADIPHEMQMSGQVRMLNAFVRPEAQQAGELPHHCCVLSTSRLLRDLIAEAVRQPALYEPMTRAGRIMALLVDEIAAMQPLALNAPLPKEPRLAAFCRDVLAAPSASLGVDEAARRVGLSRRSFTRLFREQLGVSYVAWREQACLLAAIAWFAQGRSITQVAYDLGYGSPTAFSAMFKRIVGVAPHHYRT
ncbi:helix-turn-helix domain-containing protein [Burkholderia sp. 4701]|nr:helix-turn-helix domain-containing protein [Burkholderia sp. 4701]MXN84622.1 helix-turn-helix domain-containing protein [Burkholderia sp. 4812]